MKRFLFDDSDSPLSEERMAASVFVAVYSAGVHKGFKHDDGFSIAAVAAQKALKSFAKYGGIRELLVDFPRDCEAVEDTEGEGEEWKQT